MWNCNEWIEDQINHKKSWKFNFMPFYTIKIEMQTNNSLNHIFHSFVSLFPIFVCSVYKKNVNEVIITVWRLLTIVSRFPNKLTLQNKIENI